MTTSTEFEKEMLASLPSLKAFAISLSGNVHRAEDLVQETMLRALANSHSFAPGTNMPAWLFTILRNLFRSQYRKLRREVEDPDGGYAETLKTHPEQMSYIALEEFREALGKIPQDQREAIVLVGASGFSYEQAAEILGCAVGTIKSRTNRARMRLNGLLGLFEDPRELNRKHWLDRESDGPIVRTRARTRRARAARLRGAPQELVLPRPAAPVRHYKDKAAQALYAAAYPSLQLAKSAPVVATVKPPPTVIQPARTELVVVRKPDLVVAGVPFVLEKIEKLPDGNVRQIFTLAE